MTRKKVKKSSRHAFGCQCDVCLKLGEIQDEIGELCIQKCWNSSAMFGMCLLQMAALDREDPVKAMQEILDKLRQD